MSKTVIVFYFFLILLLFSCATAPVEEESGSVPYTEKTVTSEEREALAFKKFNEILLVSRSSKDRKSVLPEMERLYAELIEEYPDVPVAEESYWKLIEIYVKDYSPPRYDMAEGLYEDFIRKYPQSGLKGFVDKTLALSYYIHKEWARLLTLSEPEYKAYVEEGTPPLPLLIFMYAEANFRLSNFEAAEEGFKIVIEDFPQLNENRRAKDRIQFIERRKR
jgi:tetratricopeptide (TPR) repeat protein